jgi:hypothetical protein
MKEIRSYIDFLAKNRSKYLVFSRRLVISEVAGLLAGIIAAEISSYFLNDKDIGISLYSGIADYSASIICFIAISYHDNKKHYIDEYKRERIKKVIKKCTSYLAIDCSCRYILHNF